MIWDVFFFVFVCATIVQIAFWLFLFSRLAFYRVKNEPNFDSGGEESLSIIICAHNEEKNLQANIPRILAQHYRSLEVLVVDDDSTDKSVDIVTSYMCKSPILHVVSHKREGTESFRSKKQPLAFGIKQARHEHLLLTDADCIPASPNWAGRMQQTLRGDTEIGLGFSPYQAFPGFLNLFIRYEGYHTALQYLSYALAGMPYMGVGRNLIYKKSLFEKANGFSRHEHIASGDDDLFISQVARADNVAIVLHPETFVYSEPKKNWRAYFRQKRRHLSTGRHYSRKHRIFLGGYSITHFLHYVTFFILILDFSTIFATLFLYTVRILILTIFSSLILKKLSQRDLIFWIPILDVAYVIFYIIFLPALFFTGNNKSWK